VAVDPALKHHHVKALVRLSAANGLYPECLVLEGIEIIGDAIGGGGFADIFKGRLLDQYITVKMLKQHSTISFKKKMRLFAHSCALMMVVVNKNKKSGYPKIIYKNTYNRLCRTSATA